LIPNLAQRVREPEVMDQPGLDAARHAHALDALARVNRLSLTAGRVWREVRSLAREGLRPVRVLDIACGDGDVLLSLGRRARRHGVEVVLTGCDLSASALAKARERATSEAAEVRFVECDVLKDELPGTHHLTTSSLFLHHLDEAGAVRLLARMAEAAERMLLVQDLRRTRLGYILAWAALRVLTTSDVARRDGPLSVRSAFTIEEARALVRKAGLSGAAEVRPCWPERFTVRWAREADI
jgi:2-polyprenyl-3-methyl-5-hydroxy-6-metoxy-1,4-benzoquinol methylase